MCHKNREDVWRKPGIGEGCKVFQIGVVCVNSIGRKGGREVRVGEVWFVSIALVEREGVWRREVRVGEGCKVFQIGVVCVNSIGRKGG